MARPRRDRTPAVPEPERLPWERRKGEAATSFHNFAMYRDLGPHRSLSKAATALGKSIETLKTQSAKYGWVERAEAYDDDVDRRIRAERETERLRLERTHFGAGAALLGVALRRLNGAEAGVGPNGPVEAVERLDPNTLDAGDVARVMETAVRVQRISSGLPTDLVKGAVLPSMTEVVRMASDLVEIAVKFIPDDRQPRFYSELQAYIDSGRRL